MPVVRFRGRLKRLAGDRSAHAIASGFAAELLAGIARAHPATKGWNLDERGWRQHIIVFVTGGER